MRNSKVSGYSGYVLDSVPNDTTLPGNEQGRSSEAYSIPTCRLRTKVGVYKLSSKTSLGNLHKLDIPVSKRKNMF